MKHTLATARRKFSPPLPPAERAPEPPAGAVSGPAIARLYVEAREHYRGLRYTEALKLYERLASLVPLDGRVSHLIGVLHLWGAGTSRDLTRAEQWFERAARAGHNYAFLSLSKTCRETGRLNQARQWLEAAASKDYPPGIFFLGHAWESGYLGMVDRAQALAYYERAAAKGYCRADWRIGAILLKGGLGVWRVPLGFVKYVMAPLRMFVLLWHDPYDERVIW